MREITFIDTGRPQLLKRALGLVRDVFWEFIASEYSSEGTAEFCDYIEYEAIAGLLEGGGLVMLGALENGTLAGVLALRVPGHVSLLFVGKPWQGRGIAKELMDATVRCVQKLSDITQITVNASPGAVPVYRKLGFAGTGGEQTINGIRFVPMALALRPPPAAPQGKAEG